MSDEQQWNQPSGQGGMRWQDESTTPKEPTLAERKARERAEARMRDEERRRREEEIVRADKERRSKTRRKRILVGTGVTVGVVALVAVGYAVAQPSEEVEAQCVDEETQEIVDDSNCSTPVAGNSSYHGGGGFYPIFIGGGGRQYHYNYGGSGTFGQRVSGGTTSVPSAGTRVFTSSGRDISPSRSGSGSSASSGSGRDSAGSSGSSGVSRGGLGSSSSSSSGS